MHEDLLGAIGILKAELVETRAFMGLGLEAAFRLARGQAIDIAVRAIDHAAGDDGLVGAAVNEIDHDLHADARNDDAAKPVSGPILRHAAPHRPRAFQIPVKLNQNTAEIIAIDLAISDHDRSLRPLYDRHRGLTRRRHRCGIRHQRVRTGKGITIAARVTRSISLADEIMRGTQTQIALA